MIDLKRASLSGGAGPSVPLAPWHPAQFCPYKALKFKTSFAGTGRSSGLGRPGKSQPQAQEITAATTHACKVASDRPTDSFW